MKVFISHGSDGSDFAELLKIRLEEEGYRVWLDSETSAPGEDWQQEIERNIRDSDALILIASPDAMRSEYANFEWAFALGAEVRVIPVLLAKTRLHPRLRALQYLDFTNRTSRPWPRLFNAVAGGPAPPAGACAA
jgi:TIR domain-containing protein